MSKEPKFDTNVKPKLFPCAICKKLTDQTCSLCRKIFYCSAQHQQIDWHMRHKMECEGKILSNPIQASQMYNTNQAFSNVQNTQTYFSPPNFQLQKKAVQIRLQNQSKKFMGLFEQRLILRRKAMDKYLKLLQTSSPINLQPEYLSLLQQLNQVSSGLLTIFKPGFVPILEQIYGITTSQFILKLDEILDRSLMARYHLLSQKHEQVRRFLFNIHDELPCYPNQDSQLRQVYENTLKTILKISELHCNDKVTEGVLAKFIIMVEKFDGIWEQVYAYFNMGNWYLQKTYYHKAIRCFNHSLQLIKIHHKARPDTNNSSLLARTDMLFNSALAHYLTNDQKAAFDNMQESYRLRVKAIGKNSIEASNCLECLSKWAFANRYWQDCLHYAKECYRVRKLNNINYPQLLQTIQRHLQAIYAQLKKEKEKSEEQMNTKPAKYFQTLISANKLSQASIPAVQPQQSFIKQLTSTVKQEMIQPKIVVTPEMAQTYTSVQWQKLTKLLYDTDRLMEKQDFRRIIFQSDFTESLDQAQKDIFIKANKIN